jgi:hypothetical protein
VTVQEVLEQIVDPLDGAWAPEFRRKYGLESQGLGRVRTAGAPTGGTRPICELLGLIFKEPVKAPSSTLAGFQLIPACSSH